MNSSRAEVCLLMMMIADDVFPITFLRPTNSYSLLSNPLRRSIPGHTVGVVVLGTRIPTPAVKSTNIHYHCYTKQMNYSTNAIELINVLTVWLNVTVLISILEARAGKTINLRCYFPPR